MPRLAGSSPIEQEIDKATQETIMKEDVSVMYEICDLVNLTPDGYKEAYKCSMRRLQNKNPRVQLLALSLLDIFVMNCGKKFHLEVCSRDFVTQCKNILEPVRTNQKVKEKLKCLLKKWASNEFKADSQLAIVDNFIQKCIMEGMNFDVEMPTLEVTEGPARNAGLSKTQEDDDIAKAIALSLEETKRSEQSTLYPSVGKITETAAFAPQLSNSFSGLAKPKEIRKVRALYDFEAAEENELSFKAGEIIIVLEDRDPNWWSGSNHRGEGLFPANFVSTDLEASPSEEVAAVTEMPHVQQVTQIEEAKIDALLQMLHDADPTTLQRSDQDAKMEALETECNLMTPLIDSELEKIDRRSASLSTLSRRLNDALVMYHFSLRQPQMPFMPPAMVTPQHIPQGMPQMPYYPPAANISLVPGYSMMQQGNPQMMPPPQQPNTQQQPPPHSNGEPHLGVPYQQ